MAGDTSRPSHRSLNWVWDTGLLKWVVEVQPVGSGGTVKLGDGITSPVQVNPTLTPPTPAAISLTVDQPTASVLLAFDGANNPIYIGRAVPGTATSAAAWQIRKLTYDGSNNPLTILFAGGVPTFTAIWDNRAALSYS